MRLPLVALATVILFAVPASAGAADGTTLTQAVEGAAASGPAPATAGETTSEPEGTTVQPAAAETEEAASTAPPAGSPAKVVSDVRTSVERTTKRLSTPTDSAPTPPAGEEARPGIDHPDVEAESAAAAITAPARRVAGRAERVRESTLGKTVARVTDPVARVTDRLSASLADTGLSPRLTDLVDPLASVTAGTAPALVTLQSDGSSWGDLAIALSRPPLAGPPPDPGAIDLGPLANAYPVAADGSAVAGIQASASGDREKVLSPAPGSFAGHAGPTIGHPGGSPSPNLPLPAPGSPATGVADSAGQSFVPIVALLALLALVAPAATRRLGGVPDFRAPTQFVCALERPG